MTIPAEMVQSLENTEQGNEAQSTKATAGEMAKLISQRLGEQQESTEQATGTEAVAGTETAEATPEISQEQLNEIEQTLMELGVDLGIRAVDVPAELAPAHNRLLQAAADMAQNSLSEQMQVKADLKEIQEFREQLGTNPSRILLTLAVAKPAEFQKAMEVFQAMQADQGQRDLIIRELEAEARLRAADRKEQVLNEQDVALRTKRVIAATRSAAVKYGVDYGLAEKFVAAQVTARRGQVTHTDVDSIVSELKPRAAAPRPKVVSAAAAKAAATTPSRPANGAAAPPGSSNGLTEAVNRSGGGGVFKSIIKDAIARLGEKRDQ